MADVLSLVISTLTCMCTQTGNNSSNTGHKLVERQMGVKVAEFSVPFKFVHISVRLFST